MSEADLNVLMEQLLKAQAYRCRSPLSEIFVNTEGQATDEGCDAWSGPPGTPDEWLGSVETCWQLKAGTAGQPAKLKGEVSKRIPRDTLTRGGRYVVVASGSNNGKKGLEDRLGTVLDEAKAEGIPTDKIFVFGSEQLTVWCNQHPAIAAHWAGRPEGLWTLDDWSQTDEHQVPWQASASLQSELDARRKELDPLDDGVLHLHIFGPPGVGKTRLALELCRGAGWRGAVLYFPQADDRRLLELLDGVAAEADVQLILVADEVEPSQLRHLRDSVGRGGGRIRLITIGNSPTPDAVRIRAFEVKPVDRGVMSTIVSGWYPEMPLEHVEFVVRFADGYVRLARLAAAAAFRKPATDVRELLSQNDIRGFLDNMLGDGDRRALYVVAVLSRVGWSEDKQAEGEAIARHLGGLDWDAVRAAVEDFDRRLGIARRGGRYRYISPTGLGNYLAIGAWDTFSEKLRTLPDALPSEDSKDAFYERLEAIATYPGARRLAREELDRFSQLDAFQEARNVRRWSSLSSADNELAARQIQRALSRASLEDRQRMNWNARSRIVATLVDLAWKRTSFHEAVTALALLAETDRETSADNASAAFVTRFQLWLGGTSVPYLERLSILDDLLQTGRPRQVELVVESLAQAGKLEGSRDGVRVAAELPEKEWRPNSGQEWAVCFEAATSRLTDIANRRMPAMDGALVKAAADLSLMLPWSTEGKLVAGFLAALRISYPNTREPLRRIIADVIHRERLYGKELSPEALRDLDALHSSFEEQSLKARLEQHVGRVAWDVDDRPDLKPLAEDILAVPGSLDELWPWLTSRDAQDAWRLGEALSAVDSTTSLAEKLPALPHSGPDLRLLAGYIHGRRQSLGDAWFDSWFMAQSQREPKPVALLFDVARLCGPPTDTIARIITATIHSERGSSELVGQLGYAGWSRTLRVDLLKPIVQAMADTGAGQTAIQILAHRVRENPSEADAWMALALELVTKPEIIRGPRDSYYWREVAKRIVPDFARELAEAILGEHFTRRGSDIWFIEHSSAEEVLAECVKQAPRAVWQALQPHLSPRIHAPRFSVGFPRGVIGRMLMSDEIMSWVAEDPTGRAAILAPFVGKNFTSDATMASRIVGEYGDDEQVANAFSSAVRAGAWLGSASAHWEQLAADLEAVADRTQLPKLRRWARESALSLRGTAEYDRQHEEEAALRDQ